MGLQRLNLHSIRSGHTFPHAPQLESSDGRYTQSAPHRVLPAGQAGKVHDPPEQTCPAEQVTPQSPQLLVSLEVLMHTPPHQVPLHGG